MFRPWLSRFSSWSIVSSHSLKSCIFSTVQVKQEQEMENVPTVGRRWTPAEPQRLQTERVYERESSISSSTGRTGSQTVWKMDVSEESMENIKVFHEAAAVIISHFCLHMPGSSGRLLTTLAVVRLYKCVFAPDVWRGLQPVFISSLYKTLYKVQVQLLFI